MKVFTANQIRACDAFTIENEPIASVDLMERAAVQLYEWLALRYAKATPFALFAGTGNNGGDALALARLLIKSGFKKVSVYQLFIGNKLSLDNRINLERLAQFDDVRVLKILLNDDFPEIQPGTILIDGIFGSGLSKPIDGYWANFIKHLNASQCEIIAIDIPSGLFADDNTGNYGEVIKAKTTLSFQFPKPVFFFPENAAIVGDWYLLDIGLSVEFIENEPVKQYFVQRKRAALQIKKRSKFGHKGDYGHAFLVAGSYQKTGAAVLAAKACLRAGAGLLTVHVPQSAYVILQSTVPEAMLCIDETELSYCTPTIIDKFSAVGIGPGIGKKQSMKNAFLHLLRNTTKSMVIDADAINLLAENKELLQYIPKGSILTPHPGEFDRLTRVHENGNERFVSQKALSKELNVIVVLKGAYTSISTPEGDVYFNSTGNPGMATAGSGDVLTGIILSLLAQGYLPIEAAIIGVFLHGLAGDLAAEKLGYESLIASDIINNLGNAFIELRK